MNGITTETGIYSITTEDERACLASLAGDVRNGGLILEVGTLYGGTTAILAQANPWAQVYTIDDYSWHPDFYPPNSPELVRENMAKIGVANVEVIKGDSRKLCKKWNKPIDLLWIDGGHSFEYVYSDLYNFGQHADVIALHDYDNPQWITIRKAIETFIAKDSRWRIYEVVGMVAVLKKMNQRERGNYDSYRSAN